MCFLCQTLDPSTKDYVFHDLGQPPSERVVNNDDSASDSVATSNSMDVGDTFSGELDYVGDTDWIAIDLEAGQSIQISYVGTNGTGGLIDPYLELRNADGEVIAYNDDLGGFSLNSEIEYTVASTGTYYIVADSYNSTGRGSYEVSVTTISPSAFDPLDTIDWGSEITFADGDPRVINVFFAPNRHTADGVESDGWNSYEQGQFQLAFDYISTLIDVSFAVTSDESDADFVLLNDRDGEIGDALGYFNPPGETNAGVGAFNGSEWDRSAGGDLEVGGFGYVTIVHELLHGLGMAHPHDNGGSSSIMEFVNSAFGDAGAYGLNQGVFTSMSYNSGLTQADFGAMGDTDDGEWGFEAGPMALDIALLQITYGANTTTASGANEYILPTANTAGTFWQAIWDTGGDDTISHSGSTDAIIDLRAATLEDEIGGGGFLSVMNGIAGGFTVANGVVIEHAVGGSGNDSLYGNDADNSLTGNGGHDRLDANRGDDTIMAGGGDDNVWGDGGNDSILGGDGHDTLRGGRENDTIEGGIGHDSIVGQRNLDTIIGGDGHDTLKGGGGSDDIDGGDDDDFIKGGTYHDTMTGGSGHDTITGNRHDDWLDGGSGHDNLNGGGDDDTLIGGTGDDWMRGGSGEDVFVFDTGHGFDTIDAFSAGDDTLDLSVALAGGMSAAQIAAAATVTTDGILLDFGSSSILLEGLSNTTGLADAIEIA